MGFFGRKRAPSVPHPRKEPRFDGPLTLERLEQIFQDCVDFTKRPVSLGEGGACMPSNSYRYFLPVFQGNNPGPLSHFRRSYFPYHQRYTGLR